MVLNVAEDKLVLEAQNMHLAFGGLEALDNVSGETLPKTEAVAGINTEILLIN